MLQFCRNRLKIEQSCRTLLLMLVQNYLPNLNKILTFLTLVIINILVLLSSSILIPNTRSLTLMILHLKPKVVNVLAKNWFIKTNPQKKLFPF